MFVLTIYFPSGQNFFSSLSTELHSSPPQAASTSTSLVLDLKLGPHVLPQEVQGDQVAHMQGRGQLVTSWSRRSRVRLEGATPGQVISSDPSVQSSFPSQTLIRLTQPQTDCNRSSVPATWSWDFPCRRTPWRSDTGTDSAHRSRPDSPGVRHRPGRSRHRLGGDWCRHT